MDQQTWPCFPLLIRIVPLFRTIHIGAHHVPLMLKHSPVLPYWQRKHGRFAWSGEHCATYHMYGSRQMYQTTMFQKWATMPESLPAGLHQRGPCVTLSGVLIEPGAPVWVVPDIIPETTERISVFHLRFLHRKPHFRPSDPQTLPAPLRAASDITA